MSSSDETCSATEAAKKFTVRPLQSTLLIYGFDLSYDRIIDNSGECRRRNFLFAVWRAINCIILISISAVIILTFNIFGSPPTSGSSNSTAEANSTLLMTVTSSQKPTRTGALDVITSMRQIYRSGCFIYAQATISVVIANIRYRKIRQFASNLHFEFRKLTQLEPKIRSRLAKFSWLFCLLPIIGFVGLLIPLVVWFRLVDIDSVFQQESNMYLLYNMASPPQRSRIPVLGYVVDFIQSNLRQFTILVSATGFYAIVCHTHLEGLTFLGAVAMGTMLEVIRRVYAPKVTAIQDPADGKATASSRNVNYQRPSPIKHEGDPGATWGGGDCEPSSRDSSTEEENQKRISEFIRWHKIICRLVLLASDSFGPSTFLAIVFEVGNIIFLLRAMNLDSVTAEDFGGPLIILFVPLFICIALLAIKVFLSTSVNDKVLSSLKAILQVDPDGDNANGNIPSIEVADKILQYVKHVQLSPPALTAWNFFVIDNSCLLSAAGYILTYTLMLYGIQ